MKNPDLSILTDEQLVARFAEIGTEQFEAEELGQIGRFNRLYEKKLRVVAELKRRQGDHRRALMALYDHPNPQVRLNAAKSTLAVAPVAARQVIQAIADPKDTAQALDAGMCLWALEEGIFKPS
ncbi:MAG TPA: DUF2019 domain-containing protein [Rhizobiaceae bacterium]|nr:DUF2019 domain-containing protein [Rhizobiaceae bacterium]